MARIFVSVVSLMLLPSLAMATPSSDPAQLEQHQAFQAVLDQAMAELMKPGPKQDGWDKGGIDIYQLVESAPGGIAGNYLLTIAKDGERSITIMRATNLARIVPNRWAPLLHAGSSQDVAGSSSLTVAGLDGPFYLAGWESHRRAGDAFCSAGNMGGKLYESPDVSTASELPRNMIPILFATTVRHIEKQSICWRYDRDGDGFKMTYFLEDGRTLPELSADEERVTIIPAGAIDQMLKSAAAAK